LNLFKFIPKDLLIDSNSSINIDIMSFLSIDCSTDIGSLFIKTKNKTFSKVLQSDKFNNDLLMKQILDFFNKHNLKFDDISKIFVNQGPGNFSALRGSLATAKGICLSKNLNLFGYNTFLWSYSKFLNKKDIVVCLLRLRNKYFVQEFNKNFKRFSNIIEISESEIIEKYVNKFKVIPKNIAKNFGSEILKLDNLETVELDHNYLEFLELKGLLDENLIKPLYLS